MIIIFPGILLKQKVQFLNNEQITKFSYEIFAVQV